MQYLVGEINPKTGVPSRLGDGSIKYDRKDKIEDFHTTEKAAEKAAVLAATTNPGKVYGLFCILRTFETTKPTILTKIVNESGELVVPPAKEK